MKKTTTTKQIPVASSVPVTLRMPPEVHAAVLRAAGRLTAERGEKVSMNSLCVELIEKGLDELKKR